MCNLKCLNFLSFYNVQLNFFFLINLNSLHFLHFSKLLNIQSSELLATLLISNYSAWDMYITIIELVIIYSNMTSFFRFVNKRASYPFGIISLALARVNVTDFSIGSINCNPNNADRGRSIIRVT
jgi:hypothetical protein